MMTPSWILDILAAVMLVVAAVSAGRVVVARPWPGSAGGADIDIAHLLMGVAMAGMLAIRLTTLPNDAWDVIFAVLAGWFGWRVYRESRGQGARVLADGHYMPHLVHSAAMLYMFVAVSTPTVASGGAGTSGMGGGSGSAMQTLSVPAVAFIFALWLAAYVVLDLDRLSGPGHGHGSYFARPATALAGAALATAATGSGPVSLAAASAAPAGPGGSTATAVGQPPEAGGGGGETRAPVGSAQSLLLSPQVAAGCRIAMGVTMAFMLIIMI